MAALILVAMVAMVAMAAVVLVVVADMCRFNVLLVRVITVIG